MWLQGQSWKISTAATFCTRCRGAVVLSVRPARTVLQQSSRVKTRPSPRRMVTSGPKSHWSWAANTDDEIRQQLSSGHDISRIVKTPVSHKGHEPLKLAELLLSRPLARDQSRQCPVNRIENRITLSPSYRREAAVDEGHYRLQRLPRNLSRYDGHWGCLWWTCLQLHVAGTGVTFDRP